MSISPQLAELVSAAIQARQKAYAPYSQFAVGAALRTSDGSVFSGCNVENASYGLAICAERNALCAAVNAGHQVFESIAIAAEPMATPCGACRQFIFEFGSNIEVTCFDPRDIEGLMTWKIDELLPEGFRFR